jgi:uncharacterized protein (TIGR00730 family)
LQALAQAIEGHPQRRTVERALVSMLQICRQETEPEAWRIISGTLADMEEALAVFRPARPVRKVAVFGSARTSPDQPAFAQARELASAAVAAGFEVITGAGGGIMEAANLGAGCEASYGLNVDLPFEQHPNPIVSRCEGRLLHFRYFFTRKLFFLRESDAVVVLPGGFGTLDELFECLTLVQTGRTPPVPLVLLAPEGDRFWSGWQVEVQKLMTRRGLISPEDRSLVFQADSATAALDYICRFYRVFHAAELHGDRVEIQLNLAVPPAELSQLNRRFDDLVDQGVIMAGETSDGEGLLRPCLRFHFNKRRMGRLYQLIEALNRLELPACSALEQPGQRHCVVP